MDEEAPKTLTLDDLYDDLMNRKILWHKSLKYWLRRKYHALRIVPRRIQWFWQRGRRGYSDADTWGFDWYLSSVIPGGVRALRERGISYPVWGVSENWDDWEKVLLQIEKSFEAARIIQDGDWVLEGVDKYDELRAEFDKGMKLFVEYYFHLWD